MTLQKRKDRYWKALLGEFWPLEGFFRSFELPDSDTIYEFEVYKRRLSVLLLRGERGLLDQGQNVGLYFGYLDHVQEEDLPSLGFHEESF
jgi:hypothetical protein